MSYKDLPERMIIKNEWLPLVILEEALPLFQTDSRYIEPLEGWVQDASLINVNAAHVPSQSFQVLCNFFKDSLYPNQPLTKLMIRNAIHNYTDSILAEVEPYLQNEMSFKENEPHHGETVEQVLDNDYMYGTMHSDYQLMRDLVTKKKQFVENGDGLYGAEIQDSKGIVRGKAELRPIAMEIFNSEKQQMWLSLVESTLSSLDEWTADLFDLISYLWIVQPKDADGYIKFHSDEALKLRFADAMKEDFYIREKERFSIMKRVAALSSIWVSMRGDNITVIDREKISDEQQYDFTTFNRMFDIGSLDMAYDKKTGKAKGIYSLQIRPAPILSYYLNSEQQSFGALDLKVFQYSHYTQREHKRLTRYLNYQWKIRTLKRNLHQPFKIKTLLDVVAFPKSYNGVQIRDRLESVLDDLQRDYVIKNWYYTEPIDEERIGKRFWIQKYWGPLTVVIVPPDEIIAENLKKINIETLASPAVNELAATVVTPPIIEQLPGTSEQIAMDLEENTLIEISPEYIADLIEQEKLSIRKAAAEMGLSHSTLLRYLNRQNKRFNKRNISKLEHWAKQKQRTKR
ncbi:helix-turn-helix domain-containing protein [Peribacillus sp. Hz7]|uniref:helix-turn-helix domain-containing protein n=1 Tax=Peribacillus sp. Hz7 TaxID=3344873 RepID=UPI0035CC0CD9